MMAGSPSAGSDRQSWGEHIDLNEYRNELLEDLNDKMEDGNFDRASRLGSMGGGLALGGIALGASALSNVLSNFSWPSLPKLEQPGWLPPELPEPGWLPLGVDEPESVPVEEPSPVPVQDPSPMPVSEPDPMPVADPDPMPVEDPKTMPVEEPSPIPVEEPDPIQVEFGVPDVSGGDLLGGLLAGGAAVGGGFLGREFLKRGGPGSMPGGAGAGSSGFGIPAPSFLIGDRAAEAQRKDRDERGFIDRKLAGLVDGLGGIGGTRMMLAGGGEGSLANLAGPVARAALDPSPDRSSYSQSASTRRPASPNVENNVSADVSPNIRINLSTDQLVKEVQREFDKAMSDVRSDLSNQIDALEADLEDLKRQIRGGR
ncbi:hypothetical protein AMR74_16865 [Halorubrum tropicale]|uniref:Uncharacterized protein n=2 Tax=Halorubrum tropicale TaxID=1765655 RepID=A0A0N0BNM9_9EURY|nr:hypothetical protein AMR74_16865 [Halorubrum tropicale]